ncbi:hypothetical protein [Acinetobacter sp. G18]|jgi:hypothetical protein|uniref:hypothetical protein n=1 Tax=Acinetobacter sp. G18 TaxID=2952152 RepID=UPI0040447902
MEKIILIVSILRRTGIPIIGCIAVNLYAGFETPQEQQKKMLAERLVITKQYTDSIIGKTAWYNSTGCLTNPIYADKLNMSYNDASYKTDDKYVPVTFLEAEVNQGTYRDDIIFKVKIDNKDEGYIEASDASKIEISDGWGCFKAENPQDKTKSNSTNLASNDIYNRWDVSCKKDAFEGKKICSVSKNGLMVLLIDGRFAVGVGRHHYPRSSSAIKIDDNVSYSGKEGIINPLYSNLIIKQMKDGKRAAIRYREWPYDYNKDSEVDLTGFTKKFNEMLDWYKKL